MTRSRINARHKAAPYVPVLFGARRAEQMQACSAKACHIHAGRHFFSRLRPVEFLTGYIPATKLVIERQHAMDVLRDKNEYPRRMNKRCVRAGISRMSPPVLFRLRA